MLTDTCFIFSFSYFLLCLSFFPPLSSLLNFRAHKTNSTGSNPYLQINALKAARSWHISPRAVFQGHSWAQQRSGHLPEATLGVTLKPECTVFTPPQENHAVHMSESSDPCRQLGKQKHKRHSGPQSRLSKSVPLSRLILYINKEKDDNTVQKYLDPLSNQDFRKALWCTSISPQGHAMWLVVTEGSLPSSLLVRKYGILCL